MRQLGAVVLAIVALLVPSAAHAQATGKVYTLGILHPNFVPSPQESSRRIVEAKLNELGWVEGQNLAIERAYAEGQEHRLPGLADDLVRRRVDVIWTVGPQAAVAAARATKTIPIVFWGVSFPVELGLVSGLARPGVNVTGVAFSTGPEVVGKQVQLLKSIVPSATRLAWMNPPDAMRTLSGAEFVPNIIGAVARSLNLELRRLSVRRPEDIEAGLLDAVDWRAHAIGLHGDPLTIRERKHIVEFAKRNRLPSTFGMRDYVEAGGLMSYGPNTRETVRQSAVYIDKILRGARPADLPVEQPIKYELVINSGTAKALGLTIPSSIMLQVDHVIE